MQPPPDVDDIRTILRRHTGLLDARKVLSIAVFGSVARADAHADSDLDFLVELDERRRPTLFDLIALEQDLSDLFGRSVDVVERDQLKPAIRRRAERDAIQIL